MLTLEQLDTMVDQVGREVFKLFLRELDLFEAGDDLVIGKEALLLPRLDKLGEFFDLGERDVDSEHSELDLQSRADGKTTLTSRCLFPAHSLTRADYTSGAD